VTTITRLRERHSDPETTAHKIAEVEALARAYQALRRETAHRYWAPEHIALVLQRPMQVVTERRASGAAASNSLASHYQAQAVLDNPSLTFLREHVEDRSWIEAVVSIPDETFRSADTAVKASILFLRRFTPEEAAARAATRSTAVVAETERVSARQAELGRMVRVTWNQLNSAIAHPTHTGAAHDVLSMLGPTTDEAAFKEAQKTIKAEARELAARPVLAGREAVRAAHDYQVFMAVAKHVGIRGSGLVDPINELPAIVEAWRRFTAKPLDLTADVTQAIFRVPWSSLDRWDPSSFRPILWDCDPKLLRPLGSLFTKRLEPVDRTTYDFDSLMPITIHFDGSIDPRDTSDSNDYTMDLFFARAGDVVVSKIDLKNGVVGIVSDTLTNVVVTNHFVVYVPDATQVFAPYLIRLVQTDFFKDYLWRKKVGSEGRKEVKIDLFEAIEIPVPDLDVQKALVADWLALEAEEASVKERMAAAKTDLNGRLIRATV